MTNEFKFTVTDANIFEGYYFKHVSDEITISFIVGISTFKDDRHCFIQVICNNPFMSKYFRFDINEIIIYNNPFKIQIKNNIFTEEGIKVDLDNINCDFNYGKLHRIKNIMGPFRFLPKMQCIHGIVSMNHEVSGNLSINNKMYLFNNEKGYIEKDLGCSFPKHYIWVQSNNFKKVDSLFLSIADIPYLKYQFNGIIVNLIYKNKEYRIATYKFGKYSLKLINDDIKITFKQKNIRLELVVHINKSSELVAPNKGQMNKIIKEGLDGEIHLKLYEDNKLIVSDYSNRAAIECVEVEKLEK